MDENTIVYIIAFAIYFLFTYLRYRRNGNRYLCCPRRRRFDESNGSNNTRNDNNANNNENDADPAYREFLERARLRQQQETLEQRRTFILDSIVVQKMETLLKSYRSENNSDDNRNVKEVSKEGSNDEENTIDEQGDEDSSSDIPVQDDDGERGEEDIVIRMEEGTVESDNNDTNSEEEDDEQEERNGQSDEQDSIRDEGNDDTHDNDNDPANDHGGNEENQGNETQDDSIVNDEESNININTNNNTNEAETTRPTLNSSVRSLFTSFKKIIQLGSTAATENPPIELLCSICLAEFEDEQEVCKSKNADCQHLFHLNCMVEWLLHHDECPLCRHDYLKDSTSSVDENNTNEPSFLRNLDRPPFPISI